jgi:hypothetical protein
MPELTPEQLGTLYADAWVDALTQQFEQQTAQRMAELEYNDATAIEARRYMVELFNWASAIGQYHPTAQRQMPTTTLHPTYRAMVEEAAIAQVEKWRAAQSKVTPAAPLTPVAIDRANPRRLDLERCRLLNFQPATYFGRPVPWQAPARFNVAQFMAQYGLDYLAPYSELLRLTTDGRVNIRAATKVWVRLFGLGYDLSQPDRPLRVTNRVRPEAIHNPLLIQFLELI